MQHKEIAEPQPQSPAEPQPAAAPEPAAPDHTDGVSGYLAGVRKERGLDVKEEQARPTPVEAVPKGIVSVAELYGGKVAKATQLKKEKTPKKKRKAVSKAGEGGGGGKPKRPKASDAMASKDTRTAEEKSQARGKWH